MQNLRAQSSPRLSSLETSENHVLGIRRLKKICGTLEFEWNSIPQRRDRDCECSITWFGC